MIREAEQIYWPLSHLHEGMLLLADKCGYKPARRELTPYPEDAVVANPDAVNNWIASTAVWSGLESERVGSSYATLNKTLSKAAPAILLVDQNKFLLILSSNRRSLHVLGSDYQVHKLAIADIRAALCDAIEQPMKAEIEPLFEKSAISEKRRQKAIRSIIADRLARERIEKCWLLRTPGHATFYGQLKTGGVISQLAALVGMHALEYALWILSWWVIGKGALQGRLETGWVSAWILLLISIVPVRAVVTALEGRIAIMAGGLLKKRLLDGALNLAPDELRKQGVGQFLGRILESEAIESLALSGGLNALIAIVEIVFAMLIFWFAAGSALLGWFTVIWLIFAIGLGLRYYYHRRLWTGNRTDITHQLIEKMVGHRTRLAQESPDRYHTEEDHQLSHYLNVSESLDRIAVLMTSIIPRGWMIFGLFGLAPLFIGSAGTGVLAICLGGIILTYRAFKRLAFGTGHIAAAVISWDKVGQLFKAAARTEAVSSPAVKFASSHKFSDGNIQNKSILNADDIIYRYHDSRESVINGCRLNVKAGEKILLQGNSGCGKSTLVSLITGIRKPTSGLILIGGLDQETLGTQQWRQMIASAPQFNDNHVLTGTFAFNLLMGRRWPPTETDLAEAETLCRQLGLGNLIDRMPAGLLQMVGESGWQLSHGEKSRLFLARAILQKAQLVILDESFAALDPENLHQTMQCVFEKAPTLMVIAHP